MQHLKVITTKPKAKKKPNGAEEENKKKEKNGLILSAGRCLEKVKVNKISLLS